MIVYPKPASAPKVTVRKPTWLQSANVMIESASESAGVVIQSAAETQSNEQSAGVVIESASQSAGVVIQSATAEHSAGVMIQSTMETQSDEHSVSAQSSNVAYYLHCYVIVKYDDQPYVGQVVEDDIEQAEIMVKCTHKTGFNRFTWPVRDDTCWYELKDIVADTAEPHLVGRHYKLDADIFHSFFSCFTLL